MCSQEGGRKAEWGNGGGRGESRQPSLEMQYDIFYKGAATILQHELQHCLLMIMHDKNHLLPLVMLAIVYRVGEFATRSSHACFPEAMPLASGEHQASSHLRDMKIEYMCCLLLQEEAEGGAALELEDFEATPGWIEEDTAVVKKPSRGKVVDIDAVNRAREDLPRIIKELVGS